MAQRPTPRSAPTRAGSPAIALASALALAALLAPGAGVAAASQRSVREELDDFLACATALERADPGAVPVLLERMRGSAATMEAQATEHHERAKTLADACQRTVVTLNDEIGRRYQEQLAQQATLEKVNQELAAIYRQIPEVERAATNAHARLSAIAYEAERRRWCNARWFRAFVPECVGYGAADLFAGKYRTLNNEARDRVEELNRLHREGHELARRSEALTRDRDAAEHAIAALLARRAELDRSHALARNRAADLVEIEGFWVRAHAAIESRATEGVALLLDLLPTLATTVVTPAGTAADRATVRTLRARMEEFATTVDAGKEQRLPADACAGAL